MTSVEFGPFTISAILPAYNEEEDLESTVSALAPALRRVASDYEILIVNDGTKDRTVDGDASRSRESRNTGPKPPI